MILYIISSSFGWIFYFSKGAINLVYNRYKRKQTEKRLLLIEDKLNKLEETKKRIYNLEFDLEEKSNPDTTFGFEIIEKDDYNIPISLKK